MTEADFKLTEGQDQAIQAAVRASHAVKAEPAVCVWSGFAGSGKTTCVQQVAAAVGEVVVVAPTGRAALRVTEATGLIASTIHRWLYVPEIDEESGEMRFSRRDQVRGRDGKPLKIETPSSRLVIVDEASMLSASLFSDLYAVCKDLHLNLLLVGDAFQLPPITEPGASSFSVFSDEFARAHHAERIFLTEIHRQAAENPIIRASMLVREGQARAGLDLLAQVRRPRLLDEAADVIDSGGVVIVHRNITRQQLNNALRTTYGLGNAPLTRGEPLLVRRNTPSVNRYNGEIVFFDTWATKKGIAPEGSEQQLGATPWLIYPRKDAEPETIHFAPALVSGNFVVLAVEEVYQTTKLHWGLLRRGAREWALHHKPGTKVNAKGQYAPPAFLSANLGYAMTAHGGQGSQWNRVLVGIEPSIRLDEEEGRRWVYTAITRAAQRTQISFLGRELPAVTSTRPLKTRQARPPAQRVLVIGDASGVICKALESISQGAIKAMQDLIIEDSLVTHEEADDVAKSYKGLVCVPRQDGTHPVKPNLLLAKAFLGHGRTVLAWDHEKQKFGDVGRVDDAGRRLVA